MEVIAGSTAESQQLQSAILLYQSFATVHAVGAGEGNRPVIKPGKLLVKEALMAALRQLLPETEQGTGLIPEDLLAKGLDYMMWWVKPANRAVWFDSPEVGGKRQAVVPNPGLVMMVNRSDWYVFAVKGNQRPTPETQIYRSPYFNVWATGKICTGSTPKPVGAKRKLPSAWVDAFYGSNFSHSNIHAPDRLITKGRAGTFWKKMLDGQFAKFPEGMLVDTGETLQSMFLKITKGK